MNHRVAGTLLLVVTLGLSAPRGQQTPPQSEPPVFRVQIDAVEIAVDVTDGRGNPVTDLTADDFEVTADRRRQTLTSFARVDIPIPPADQARVSPAAIEPDVQTNDSPEGRYYAIVFDEVAPALALRTRHLLRAFVDRLGEHDRTAVFFLGRARASDGQDFTSNRRLILNAIDRFTGGFADDPLTPPPVPPDGAATDDSAQPLVGSATTTDAAFRAVTAMGALRQLSEFMATLEGRRKAMIFVSTGVPYNMFSVIDNSRAALSVAGDDAREALRAVMRGNVAVYPIDPRGLTAEGGSGEQESSPTSAQLTRQREIEMDARASLRALADVTGGFALTNSNSFDDAFDRIVRRNSSYYMLGFQAADARRDGRFHGIRVRVTRPGVQVRARDGYLAPTDRPVAAPPRLVAEVSPAVADALSSAVPVSGLPMRIVAAPYLDGERDPAVAVAVEIGPAGLELQDDAGVFKGELEVAHIAIAASGRAFPGDRHHVSLALRPDTYERVQAGGIRVLLEPRLPPGRYQLRVAAGLRGGRAGSVVSDLEIPDVRRGMLTMSGVSLASASAGGVLTVRVQNPLGDRLPGPMTTAREFVRGERIALYAEVYQNAGSAAAHTVSFTVELRADDGRLVHASREERASRALAAGSGTNGFTAEIPLDVEEPGVYTIHVEAQATTADRPTVRRAIRIRVF